VQTYTGKEMFDRRCYWRSEEQCRDYKQQSAFTNMIPE